jgi:hypothetical protein
MSRIPPVRQFWFNLPKEEGFMRRHELSDEEWAIIAPLLPNQPAGCRGSMAVG